MWRKWIAWILVGILGCTSAGFALDERPEPAAEMDGRLQLIRSMEIRPDFGFHFGNVVYMQDGNIAAAISETIDDETQTHLVVYSREGKLVQEVVGGDTSECWGPVFILQTADGALYTTDGKDLLTPDEAWEELMDLGSLVEGESESESPYADIYGVFHVSGEEIGAVLGSNEMAYPVFLDYGETLDRGDLKETNLVAAQESEMEEALPAGYRLTEFFGFDYGESKDTVYLLIGVGEEVTEDYYVLEASKSLEVVDGEMQIRLSREGWTKLALPENTQVFGYNESFAVSDHGFEVVIGAKTDLKRGSRLPESSELVRFSYKGEVMDRVQVPGGIFFFDTDGNQSVIVSWYGPEFGNALYLMNWEPESSGTPKGLIAERTVKGKTLARFRDSGYGLLKTEDEEAGAVDYLAPLKTEANDVRLQIPLNDLLARQSVTARDLVILYGDERIRMPMAQLDCTDLLASMPCQDDATVEIRLLRMEDGTVSVKVELFVVEQLDSKTKCVYRTAIDM